MMFLFAGYALKLLWVELSERYFLSSRGDWPMYGLPGLVNIFYKDRIGVLVFMEWGHVLTGKTNVAAAMRD